jgi:LPXTG-site transpeptidase (sortase) family protein
MYIRLWISGLIFFTILLNTALLETTPTQAQTEITAEGSPLFFPETGHTLAYSFRSFWEQNGGLSIFGFPITEVYVENGRPVQYFERARLEWFGDLVLTQGGLLGRWAAGDKQNQLPFKSLTTPILPSDALDFYPQTGHMLGNGFRNYWRTHGGLAVFGYPISEEFQEKNSADGKLYTVQYFERARFEYHSDNPIEYQVELGLLGREYLGKMHPAPPTALAEVSTAASAWDGVRPTHIKLPRIKVDTDVVEGGFSFNVWDVPRYTAVHYWPVSGFPGSPGNMIIAGHAGYRDTIFDHLPAAVLGDEIILSFGAEQKKYKITEILTLLPEDSWVMDPTRQETVTLITCVPPGVFNHRLVIRAVPEKAN